MSRAGSVESRRSRRVVARHERQPQGPCRASAGCRPAPCAIRDGLDRAGFQPSAQTTVTLGLAPVWEDARRWRLPVRVIPRCVEIQSVLVAGYGVAAVHARTADHIRQWKMLFEEGVNRLGLHDVPHIVQIRERIAGGAAE